MKDITYTRKDFKKLLDAYLACAIHTDHETARDHCTGCGAWEDWDLEGIAHKKNCLYIKYKKMRRKLGDFNENSY